MDEVLIVTGGSRGIGAATALIAGRSGYAVCVNYLKNKTKILSLNNVGNLTYPYEHLEGNTDIIKEIINDQHTISSIIKEAKKPLIISDGCHNIESINNVINEIDKLYLYSNGKMEKINSIINSNIYKKENQVWKLLDSIGKRNISSPSN